MYRSGLAQSRPQSRQLISHCHILVNGRKVNVPSYQMKIGDIITVRERSKALFRSLQEGRSPVTPSWLEVDAAALAVRFAAVPMREEIDPTLNEHLIIEFYSR